MKKLLTASSCRTSVEFMVRVWGSVWGSVMVWGPLPVFNQGSGDIYSGKGSYCPESVFINPTPQYSPCPSVLVLLDSVSFSCFWIWKNWTASQLLAIFSSRWSLNLPVFALFQQRDGYSNVLSSSQPHFPFNTCFCCLKKQLFDEELCFPFS